MPGDDANIILFAEKRNSIFYYNTGAATTALIIIKHQYSHFVFTFQQSLQIRYYFEKEPRLMNGSVVAFNRNEIDVGERNVFALQNCLFS